MIIKETNHDILKDKQVTGTFGDPG